ncbi:hypothetical protein ACFL01_02855 [Planctomycetota bacterium]
MWQSKPHAIWAGRKSELINIRAAIQMYHEHYGDYPSRFQQLFDTGIGIPHDYYGEYVCIGGDQGVLAFRKEPFPAVQKGAALELGETAKEFIPPRRLVLLSGSPPQIVMMEEDEFQKKYTFRKHGLQKGL